MKQDLEKIFHALVERYYTSIDRNCNSRIKKARDKEHVINEIKKDLDFSSQWLVADENKKKLADVFDTHYKTGESVDWIIALVKEAYGKLDLEPSVFRHDEETGKMIPLFPSEKDKELAKLAADEKRLLKFFVRYHVYTTYRKRFGTVTSAEALDQTGKQKAVYAVRWTGKKDNRNEFVQLIYGIHEAGLLNNGKGEITKIVETLAGIFDVKLSSNWQSNLSKSIHNATVNYEPEIFDAIKTAYSGYCSKKRKEKKQNRFEM